MNKRIEHPISWLTLEMYYLDELSEKDRAKISSHMEICHVCRQCGEEIKKDTQQALPPLPALLITSTPVTPSEIVSEETRGTLLWFPNKTLVATMVAMAAAVAVFIIWPAIKIGVEPSENNILFGVKGSAPAVSLVRNHGGLISENPETYSDGDIFNVQITCSEINPIDWEIAIFQEKQIYYPYSEHPRLTCGNKISIPGAFSLTGTVPTTVCLLMGDDLSESITDPEKISEELCITLNPNLISVPQNNN